MIRIPYLLALGLLDHDFVHEKCHQLQASALTGGCSLVDFGYLLTWKSSKCEEEIDNPYVPVLAIIVEKGELYCDCVNDLPAFGMNPIASELVMSSSTLKTLKAMQTTTCFIFRA